MSLLKKGTLNELKPQPGWEIVESDDDTIRATLVYEGDWNLRSTAPTKGSRFPFTEPLVCFERRQKRLGTEKVEITCDFIGISSDPTPFKIEYPGGSATEAIETHPNFSRFAGTPQQPKNGALFDPETEEFLGFTDPENRKYGTRSYYVPNVIVNVSYWSWRVPQARRIAREVKASLPNVLVPGSVKNFLLIGLPYRQVVGKLYAITEQWLGSGELGWDSDIYR